MFTAPANFPRPFALERINMAIGIAVVALTIPSDATHIMANPASGELSQKMLLHMVITGFTAAQALILSFSGATGGVPFFSGPVPIPRDVLITAYSLRREATAAAVDYCVHYLRV